nr:hypothetical protein BgiMline_013430 [Biomphalaria glabrata]
MKMAAFSLFLICQLIIATQAALVIDVQPSRIKPGLTNSLVVNCSITDNKVPQMLKIYSLVLSRVSPSRNDSFEELIILNYNDRNSSLKSSNVPEGSIGINGASHISLTWPNPSYRDANKYRCEARGLSTNFNKISATAYASVETDEPSIKSLVDELLLLRKETYYTANSFKEVKQKYTSLNEDLQKSVNKLSTEKQLSKNSLFHASNQSQGRRYYLSRRQYSNEVNQAQATCLYYGGYLAEIDTTDEYTFVVNFLKLLLANDSRIDFVLTGLMDPENDGIWTHIHSKKDSKFLPWAKDEPKNQVNNNCLWLDRGNNWLYRTFPCYINGDNFRFLCEIPEEAPTVPK